METKQVIVMIKKFPDKDGNLKPLRTGKYAAQAAHAAMAFLTRTMRGMDPGKRDKDVSITLTPEQQAWVASSFAKVVCYVETESDLRALIGRARSAGLVVNDITDAGRTEFGGVPTLTCAAFGPHRVDAFKGITDQLPLM